MNTQSEPFEGVWGENARLLRDLQLMLKRDGFKAARISKAPNLQRVLGGSDEPFDDLRERFISAIQSLNDPEPELLLDAFALSPETERLTGLPERYVYFGDKVGLKIDAVRLRVGPAIEHLRNQLTTGWYPKSPLPFRVPESHNGIVNESVYVQTIVRDMKWQETRERYRFVAAFDEADYLGISSTQAGPIETVGSFTVERLRIDDHFEDRFYSSEPMRRGSSYDLQFRRLPEPGVVDPYMLVGEWRGFHEPTRLATFDVAYLGKVPRLVWKFTGLTHLQSPGEPEPGQLLKLVKGQFVRARFPDLYGGLFSGVAWEW